MNQRRKKSNNVKKIYIYQRKLSRRCWSAKLHHLGTYLNPDVHIIVQVVKLSISIMRDKPIISMEMEIRGYNICSNTRKGLKHQVTNSWNYYWIHHWIEGKGKNFKSLTLILTKGGISFSTCTSISYQWGMWHRWGPPEFPFHAIWQKAKTVSALWIFIDSYNSWILLLIKYFCHLYCQQILYLQNMW